MFYFLLILRRIYILQHILAMDFIISETNKGKKSLIDFVYRTDHVQKSTYISQYRISTIGHFYRTY